MTTAQEVIDGRAAWAVECGDCLDVLPTLPAESFDACFCDPPYPEVDREYGNLTESEWHSLMRAVVPEVRRVLQPNSERVGRMRPWLFDFQAWLCREWNMVQDAWWLNTIPFPSGGCTEADLLRPALKACVWAGPPDCHRDQAGVLWDAARDYACERLQARCERKAASGRRVVKHRIGHGVAARGGVTPYNVIPLSTGTPGEKASGHAAPTPLALCNWWTRYLVPPGGAVLDPFAGSGTTGLAALRRGCTFVGIERLPEYVAIARHRLAEVDGPLFAAPVREG
jgi:DNA modification methylase